MLPTNLGSTLAHQHVTFLERLFEELKDNPTISNEIKIEKYLERVRMVLTEETKQFVVQKIQKCGIQPGAEESESTSRQCSDVRKANEVTFDEAADSCPQLRKRRRSTEDVPPLVPFETPSHDLRVASKSPKKNPAATSPISTLDSFPTPSPSPTYSSSNFSPASSSSSPVPNGTHSPLPPKRCRTIINKAATTIDLQFASSASEMLDILNQSLTTQITFCTEAPGPEEEARTSLNLELPSHIRSKYLISHIQCGISGCTIGFGSANQLEKHLRLTHNLNPVPCPVKGCGGRFEDEPQLAEHFQAIHHSNSLISCSKCTQTFSSPVSLYEHTILDHQIGCYACANSELDGCPFLEDTPRKVIQHFEEVHQQQIKVAPDVAAFKISPPKVKVQLTTASPTKAPKSPNSGSGFEMIFSKLQVIAIRCTLCQVWLDSRRKLQEHLEIEHLTYFHQCPAKGCGYSFPTKKELSRHIKVTHEDVTSWPCVHCDHQKISFDQHRPLVVHQQFYHFEGQYRCLAEGCSHVGAYMSETVAHWEAEHGEKQQVGVGGDSGSLAQESGHQDLKAAKVVPTLPSSPSEDICCSNDLVEDGEVTDQMVVEGDDPLEAVPEMIKVTTSPVETLPSHAKPIEKPIEDSVSSDEISAKPDNTLIKTRSENKPGSLRKSPTKSPTSGGNSKRPESTNGRVSSSTSKLSVKFQQHSNNSKYIIEALECIKGSCGERYATSGQLADHLRRVHHVGSHRCPVKRCNRWLPTRFHLMEHFKTDHGRIAKWTCAVCSSVHPSSTALNSHYIHEHHRGSYRCSSCSYKANTRGRILEHFQEEHSMVATKRRSESEEPEPEPVQQTETPKKTRTRPKYFKILKVKCTECTEWLPSMISLAEHQADWHGHHSYRCYATGCGKSYKTLSQLLQHIRSTHHFQIWPCPQCPEVFPGNAALSVHIFKVHSLGAFACTQCQVESCCRADAEVHYERYHLAERGEGEGG